MTRFGQLALGGQREHALVARPVLADEPGPVDGDQHRLVVLADVVDGLVERALQERRVERDDRPHAAHREPGRERHRVLLGDPDVEEPVRERRPGTWTCPVPVGMPAVIPTIRRSVRASSMSSAAKTAV